jgi:hypothetical protein
MPPMDCDENNGLMALAILPSFGKDPKKNL